MFDNEYFGISTSEAQSMDPNQKIILETIVSACYDSGMNLDRGGDRIGNDNVTGVFIGMSNSDFENVDGSGFKDGRTVYSATGSALSVTAGRVSFLLGFRGPSMVIDTACSSSLVAMNQACMALQISRCNTAVVAGVNLILTPWISIQYARAGMTSVDGKCHTFDESANGYSRGEGCVAMVLKRLDDAVRDGDGIYAVIRGSAVMQDGKSASLTAPNGLSQQDLIKNALDDAGVSPNSVSYLEAHGTGTKLGDPIETEALSAVYCQHRGRESPLAVSSVKANIGHLEAAAGITGVLSAILALQTGQAPPNAQLNLMNKKVMAASENLPMVFPTIAQPLHRVNGHPLLAGVSSFGYSGTIAHVILEEAPKMAIRKVINQSEMPTIARDNSEAASSLNQISDDIVFQFVGQGVLAVGVASYLFESEPVFRRTMIKFDTVISELIGVSILSLIYPDSSNPEMLTTAETLLQETRYAQPVLVAIECSMAEMWLARGVVPSQVLGHSIGEYSACYTAGVFTLEDTAKLVCKRGELTHLNEGCRGCMYAMRASASEVNEAIRNCGQSGSVSLAAVNGPKSVVVSGSVAGLDAVVKKMSGVSSKKLNVANAFHSPLMTCILPEFSDTLSSVKMSEPTRCKLISTVKGCETTDDVISTQYWLDHIAGTVRYQQVNMLET